MQISLNSLDDLFSTNYTFEKQPELQELLSKYKAKFGQAFPMYIIPDSIVNNELCEKIKECIETNDGNILKRLGIKVDNDVLY